MIEWKPVQLSDQQAIDSWYKRFKCEVSDLTFTNIWIWGHERHPYYAFVDGFLCVHLDDHGVDTLLMPVGEGNHRAVLKILSEDFARRHHPLHMRAVVDGSLRMWQEAFPGPHVCSPDTKHFDYIYFADDLRELHGNKFQAKRNHVHQFMEHYNWEYRPLTQELVPAVIKMQELWYQERADKQQILQSEHVSVLKLLQDFEKLSVFGGVILVDGAIVAFSIAELLTDEMLLVHAEKALVAYKGVYQMINQQLVLHAPSSIHFVNREEDLGIPSLAKAKQSYHPVRFIRKWMLEN